MPTPNTIADKPTRLNLEGFRGNTLTVRLTVAGSAPMPASITTIAKVSDGGRVLASAIQPSISVAGRTVTIVYEQTDTYPTVSWHQIAFDDRWVLAGGLYFNYATTPSPVLHDVTVRTEEGVNIGVTILVGASAGGGSGELPPIDLAVVSQNQTVWDLGLNESRRTLWVNNIRYFEGDDYTISLPLLTWQGDFPIKAGFDLKLT